MAEKSADNYIRSNQMMSIGDFECDNVTYPVSVIWIKNSFWGEIRAYEQPAANACRYGG